jgi:hypothetical protein
MNKYSMYMYICVCIDLYNKETLLDERYVYIYIYIYTYIYIYIHIHIGRE